MNKYFTKRVYFWLFLAITLISIVLRLYQLGTNPPSLDWDEASLGYNAYSILQTGSDEYGVKYPLSIRSFDDHKPPLYVYLTVPSVALLGLNDAAVRLPSVIMGIITVIATYFLVIELLTQKGIKKIDIVPVEYIALLSMFFMSISPWHLQFSRTAFEGNIGLSFFVLGVFFLLRGVRNGRELLIAAVSFGLCLYSYHSFRLVVPIFLLSAFLIFRKDFIREKLFVVLSTAVLFLMLLPVLLSFLAPSGAGSRLSMVTIFGPSQLLDTAISRTVTDRERGEIPGSLFHNRRVVYALAIAKGYLDHFNPDFLFLHGDGGRQHHAVDMGMLYLWELPFILLGIFYLANHSHKRILLLFIWFLLAPIASAISTGTPHPVRAIAMIPPFHIFTAVGVVFLLEKVAAMKKQQLLRAGLVSVMTMGLFLNIMYYLHQYYIHTPIEYGDFWQYGYKEVFETLKKEEKNAEKFLVTYKYDQPYIYYLYYNKIDPVWFQKNWDYQKNGQTERFRRVIGQYEFKNIDWGKDQHVKNAVIVGSPDEIPSDAPGLFKEIYFPDGRIAFRLVRT